MRDGLAIGLDVGTSSVTAVLFDPERGVLARAGAAYDVDTPAPGWAEQDPRVWWSAAASALAQLDRSGVTAVAVSAQGAALVLLDAAGQPVRPALIHLDSRAASVTLDPRVHAAVRSANGNAVGAWNVASKLAWIRRHEPDSLARTATVTSAAGSLLTWLTGRRIQSASDAGISDLFDRPARDWSAPVCRAAGVDSGLLPEVVAATTVVGQARADLGLPPGTVVVAGGEDAPSAALAAGVIAPGDAFLSLGTAAVVGVATPRGAANDIRLLSYPHVRDKVDIMSGSMTGGGGALVWWSSVTGRPVGELLDEAARTRSGEALFLPYLAGELHPVNDPQARAVFAGLSLATGRAELSRAIVDGTAAAIADNLDVVAEAGNPATVLSATGKPSRSAFWMQAVADAAGVAVESVEEEGAALGDAILALAETEEEIAALARAHRRVRDRRDPDPHAAEAHRERRARLAAFYATDRASRHPAS